jgi:hypothetical protein
MSLSMTMLHILLETVSPFTSTELFYINWLTMQIYKNITTCLICVYCLLQICLDKGPVTSPDNRDGVDTGDLKAYLEHFIRYTTSNRPSRGVESGFYSCISYAAAY